MFTRDPIFVRFQQYGQRFSGGAWWLVMAPGLVLSLFALAILVWPQLLAYMVAGILLFAGVSLTLWGWSMRQVERRNRGVAVRYDLF
ncbi:MAG: hypothetical protein M3Q45_10420 [Chloroflexota bacterium]|nr:hypothetical protein [Chloroflexota bacterium]